MYCIFHEVSLATFMIHPEGFKTILDCFSHQDNLNIWNILYMRESSYDAGTGRAVLDLPKPLPHSRFLSVRQLCHMHRVTALSIKRSMCLLPLNQVD